MPENSFSRTEAQKIVVRALPWEEFRGFLWGFPATWWLIMSNPIKAFSAPVKAGWARALVYALIVFFITYLLLLLSSYDYTNFLHDISSDKFFWHSLQSFVVFIPINSLILVFFFTVIPLWFLQKALGEAVLSFTGLLRLCFYIETLASVGLIMIVSQIIIYVNLIPITWIQYVLICVWLAIGLSNTGKMPRGKAGLIAVVATIIRFEGMVYINVLTK